MPHTICVITGMCQVFIRLVLLYKLPIAGQEILISRLMYPINHILEIKKMDICKSTLYVAHLFGKSATRVVIVHVAPGEVGV